MKQAWIFCLAALALLLAAQPSAAVKEEQREKVRRQISSIKVWQLSKELDLSEEQAEAFVPAQRDYELRKADLHRRRARARADLEGMLDRKAERARITQQLEEIRSIDRELGRLELDFHQRISQILTLEQQARYEIILPRVNRRIKDIILDVQRGKGSRGFARDSLREKWGDDSLGVRGKSHRDSGRRGELRGEDRESPSRSDVERKPSPQKRSSRETKDSGRRSGRSGRSR